MMIDVAQNVQVARISSFEVVEKSTIIENVACGAVLSLLFKIMFDGSQLARTIA